jgi:uncharacterized repeat protein (TIGR03809 family)
MTHHLNVAVRREIAARWCALAEKRLQYLTELFESGRWRRFHSEFAFLENLREAKAAVETWRALSGRPIAQKAEPPRLFNGERRPQPLPLTSAPSIEASLPDEGGAEQAQSAAVIDFAALERALNVATPPPFDLATIEKRYPLLRNAL